tara:strand:+ start:6163 stop:6363 length:201 start_codon:yes stop_codon:yes gene_type:complete
MGLIEKTKRKKTLTAIEDKHAKAIENKLTVPELHFLLKLIANSAFQGKDLQLIYDLTAKLQKQTMD